MPGGPDDAERAERRDQRQRDARQHLRLAVSCSAATTDAGARAPAPLAIANLYGPDAYSGAINPQDPRQVYTAYKPRYFADEINAEAKIEHDFGKVKLDVSGLYQRNTVDSSQDYDLALNAIRLASSPD